MRQGLKLSDWIRGALLAAFLYAVVVLFPWFVEVLL